MNLPHVKSNQWIFKAANSNNFKGQYPMVQFSELLQENSVMGSNWSQLPT